MKYALFVVVKRVTLICLSEIAIIGSDDGLSQRIWKFRMRNGGHFESWDSAEHE